MIKEQEEAIENIKTYIHDWVNESVDEDGYERYAIEEYDKEFINAVETVLSMIKEKDEKIEKVLELIFQYGQIDGDHHKAWVIDQAVRILTGEKYKQWIKEYIYDEETGESYSWYKGIAP